VLEAFRVLVAAFTAALRELGSAHYIVAWPSPVSVSLISHVSSKVKLTVNPQRLIVFRRT
jgi:hypothetical protein